VTNNNTSLNLVSVLTPISTRTGSYYIQIVWVDLEFDWGRFVHDSDRDGAGMNFSCGSVLPTMATRFIFEDMSGILTDLKNCQPRS
jgi:hypothetical protein